MMLPVQNLLQLSLFAVAAVALLSPHAAFAAGLPGKLIAGPQPLQQLGPHKCERIKDPVHGAAIAAAQSWWDTRWAPMSPKSAARGGWMTAYVIPAPPPAPLGIGSLARGQELGAEKGLPSAPIAGFALVAKLLCVTRAPSPDGTVSIQFLGRALRFKEGTDVWSKPLRQPALLHALVLSRPAPEVGWAITEEPEARTALIPGSRLSRPSAADLVPPAAGHAKRGHR